jgi:hypothetical protein
MWDARPILQLLADDSPNMSAALADIVNIVWLRAAGAGAWTNGNLELVRIDFHHVPPHAGKAAVSDRLYALAMSQGS